MFVRQLIGRQAGEIIEMRADAAQACLAQGSAATVTDEELAAAGIAKPPTPIDTAPAMTAGYEAHSRPDGLGYDVFRSPVTRGERNEITSESLNSAPLPNLVAARDFAADHAAAATSESKRALEESLGLPEDWRVSKADDMKALAVQAGADPAPTTKADALAFLEAKIAAASAPQA